MCYKNKSPPYLLVEQLSLEAKLLNNKTNMILSIILALFALKQKWLIQTRMGCWIYVQYQ